MKTSKPVFGPYEITKGRKIPNVPWSAHISAPLQVVAHRRFTRLHSFLVGVAAGALAVLVIASILGRWTWL